MSQDDLKKKILSTDSDSLRKKSVTVDESVDFENDSKRDTHQVKKRFKKEFENCAPIIVKALIFIAFGVFIAFGILGIKLVTLIWSDKDALLNIVTKGITHAATLVIGLLSAILYKHK